MATELAKAYVQIIPSANGIQGSISNVLNGEAESAGENSGNAYSKKFISVAKVALAAGAVALGKVISESFTQGAALEQSIGGIETLFGDSADKMKEYAKQAYQTAGVSANTYMEQATSFAAALVSSLGGNTELAAEVANQAIVDMSDNANKMGTDITDIQNAYQGFAKQNYTMLDNLKLGYGGTKTEMERLLADAEELTGIHYDIDNLSDVYEAIHVIQEDLGITGTTAEEAATTFSGSFASMKAAAENLLGYMAIGADTTEFVQALSDSTYTFLMGNFIPMLSNVFTSLPSVVTGLASAGYDMAMQLISNLSKGFSGNVTSFIDNVFPMLVEFTGTIRENAGALIDEGLNLLLQLAQGIANGIPTLVSTIPQIVTNIAGIINDNAPKILTTGIEIIGTLVQGIIQAIPTIVANIPQIITAIVSVFTAYNWVNLGSTIVDGITKFLKELPSTVSKIASDAVSGISEFFFGMDWNSIGTFLVEGIQAGASTLVSILGDLVSTAIGSVSQFFITMDWVSLGTTLLNGIKSGALSLGSTLLSIAVNAVSYVCEKFVNTDWVSLGTSLLNGIKNGALNLGSKLLEIATGAISDVIDEFVNTDWLSVGSDIVEGIKNGVTGAVGGLVESASGLCSDFLGSVKSFFGIASPSTVMEEQGGYLVDGMINGITDLPSEMLSVLTDALSNVTNWGSNLVTSATASASSMLSGVTQYFTQLPGNMLTQLNSALAKATSFGSSLVSKLKSSASQAISGAVTYISQLPGKMLTQLNSALSKVTSFGSSLVSKLKTSASSAISGAMTYITSLPGKVLTQLNNVISKVKSWGSSIVTQFKSIGKNVMQGLINGIKGMVSSLYSSIKSALSGLVSKAKSALGIGSPSKIFNEEIGAMIDLGLAEGIEGNLNPVESAMDELNNTTLGAISTDLSYTSGDISNSSTDNADLITEMIDLLKVISEKDTDVQLNVGSRQLAYAIAGDMNVALNKINKSESRK